MTRIVFLILIKISVLTAWAFCPSIPSQCVCSDMGGMVVIDCNGVNFKELVEKIGVVPVDRLTVSNCTLPVIDILPRGALRSLEIRSCGTETVNSKIFHQVKHTLEELILVNNELTVLPIFGKLPKLFSLNLSGNKLSVVHEESFKGLPALRRLELSNNRICDFARDALEWTPLLEFLDLSENCLTEMPSLDLTDLKEIRLNNNQLTTLGSMPFRDVPRLQYLSLGYNRLDTVDGDELQFLQALKSLEINDNLLTKIPIFKNFPNLKTVYLFGNIIDEIFPLNFSNNSRLSIINLGNNKISHIPKHSFVSMNNLQLLNLANNSLTSLDEGALNDMPRLLGLNLMNNSLTHIAPKALLSVPHLSFINLENNQLEMIESSTFLHLPKLESVQLANNRLHGFEKETFNNSLRMIQLTGNPLECNEKFEWFVTFLAENEIYTRHPELGEVLCLSPVGVRLKDLIAKAKSSRFHGTNQTISSMRYLP